jgi:hypothetical protein
MNKMENILARKLGEVILSLGEMPLVYGLLVFFALIMLTILFIWIGPRLPTDHKKWSFGVLVLSFIMALLRRGEAAGREDIDLNVKPFDLNDYPESSSSGGGAPQPKSNEIAGAGPSASVHSSPPVDPHQEDPQLREDLINECKKKIKSCWDKEHKPQKDILIPGFKNFSTKEKRSFSEQIIEDFVKETFNNENLVEMRKLRNDLCQDLGESKLYRAFRKMLVERKIGS